MPPRWDLDLDPGLRESSGDLYDLRELLGACRVDARAIWPLFERKARHRDRDPDRFGDYFTDHEARWTNELSAGSRFHAEATQHPSGAAGAASAGALTASRCAVKRKDPAWRRAASVEEDEVGGWPLGPDPDDLYPADLGTREPFNVGRMKEVGGDDGRFKPFFVLRSFDQANVIKLQARPTTGGDVNVKGEDMPFERMGSSYRSRLDRGRNFNPCLRLGERRSRECCCDKRQCHHGAHRFSLGQQIGQRAETDPVAHLDRLVG